MKSSEFKSFNYLENGEIQFSIFETVKTVQVLDAGFYELWYEPYPKNTILLKQSQCGGDVKDFNYPDKEKLDSLFDAFFNPEVVETVSKLGFIHKAGILLHGKEGTGKSTIFRYYANESVQKEKAIVFYLRREYLSLCWAFIQNIRMIQKNPIIIIFEEIEQHIGFEFNEGIMKTILDGNLSINNCLFFGTTNYIDKIPTAIKDRPSRFKYTFEIEGIQDSLQIVELLYKMIGNIFEEDDIKNFAEELKGSSIDVIKHFAMDKIMNLKAYKKNKKRIGFI